jgi:signal transduction histidine kinase
VIALAKDSPAITAALRAVPLFARLTESQAALLAATGVRRKVLAGEVVFRESQSPDGLHVVLEGRLRIYKRAEDDTEVDLSTAGPGDTYGEMALLDDGVRSASVVALEPTELLVLGREPFLRLLSESSPVLASIMSQLTRAVRDTSVRLLREELEQRAVKAEMETEKYRALAVMVAGVAHEINTPIGIVNTAASIVRQRLDSTALREAAGGGREAKIAFEDATEALVLIERNVERAHRLIENFKKLSVSQVADTLENLNLLDVIDETVQLFSVSARRSGLSLEILNTLPDHAAAAWRGYRGFLSQVLLNLFTNAERYAYPGGVGGRIEILVGESSERDESFFTVQVRDFGRGIEAEALSRVFEPFFTTGRAIGGSGLGLAIVRNLVTTSLKGTVAVQSALGEGTTFRLVIPRTVTE